MTMHILAVDDHVENLYYLSALFAGVGFEVTEASNGREALAQAHARRPTVVISDLLMPEMDGYTLLRAWKRDPALREVPFIVYTATYTHPDDERLARELGADLFLVKPMDPDRLLSAVREVIDRRAVEPASQPQLDEPETLRLYSATLIRKLEEKSSTLEATNQTLQAELGERLRTERALAEARSRLADLVHSIDGVVFELDAETLRVEFISEQATRLLGVPAQAWTESSDPWSAVLHPGDRARGLAMLRACADTGEGGSCELRLLHRDGTGVWVRMVVSPSQRSQWRSLLRGLIIDITEQRGASQRLLQQDALVRIAGVAARIGGWRLDAGATTLIWSDETRILHGVPPGTALSLETSIAHYAPEYRGDLEAAVARCFAEGTPFDLEVELMGVAQRRRWVRVIGEAVRDDADQIIAIQGALQDIHERRSLEQQMFRAQRMESIGTLAGGIAHDLNNVLAPIVMAVDLLRSETEDPDTLETIDLIGTSARRGAEMVRQVLTFSRGISGRRVPCDATALVRDVAAIVAETFPKGIALEVRTSDIPGRILGDTTQLHQVLLNLCVNARDAMHDAGHLTLEVEPVTIDAQYAGMTLDARDGEYVRFEVRDTGTGIAPEILDHIFDPFFTTKEVGRGTGLGLATTQAIVRSHGGFLTVYSEPGNGACFRAYFPLDTGAAVTADPAEDNTDLATLRGRGESVLVVDDEPAIRQVTRQTLEAAGYVVLEAADGSEALSTFLLERDRIDLILTDMMMPVMDGSRLIRVLHRLAPQVPVIGASGLADGARPADADRPQPFLAKPFTASALLRAVRSALDARG